MAENLLVGVIGHRNSGKSETWYRLFGQKVRTSQNRPRPLYLSEDEYVEVVLVNGSPEERGASVEDILKGDSPRIVLCSMQYRPGVQETLNYFEERGYQFYIQWLNPGYRDASGYADHLGLTRRLSRGSSIFLVRNGREPTDKRVGEIRDFIASWAGSRNLILRVTDLALAVPQ